MNIAAPLQNTAAKSSLVSKSSHAGLLLQRKCACGGVASSSLTGECDACENKRLQTKLSIGASNDPLEQEADRVANQVLAASPHSTVSGAAQSIQRFTGQASGDGGTAPPSVDRVLSSSGRPLDLALQQDMGQRFGHDFSLVRVHTGSAAEQSARDVSAHAYTVGHHIVFGSGRFAPRSHEGQRLLAHELAHVVQQSGRPSVPQMKLGVSTPGDASERQADAGADAVMSGRAIPSLGAASSSIQRTCGQALGPPSPDCSPSKVVVTGQQFLFDVNCDDLKEVEIAPGKFKTGETAVADFAKMLGAGSKINVHGFASGEGPVSFNEELSCHRANKAASLLRGAGLAVADTFKHGGISQPPVAGFWRSVIVEVVKPQPKADNLCGPDVTDWLVDQVAKAKTDKVVLDIQANLAGASRIAASNGFSAERVTEGGVAKKMFAEESRTSPTSTAEFPRPTAQIAASVPGQKEFGRALIAATAPLPFVGAPEQQVFLAIKRASIAWKGLVGTGMKYDFKNNVLKAPTSKSCPTNCASSLTLCPSPAGSCFNTDLPGNLFYAHVGRFIGFTELALQLGSQFAQLESTAHWDPPEDTSMISIGSGMKHPLNRAELCSAVASLRGNITLRACVACPEATALKPV